MRYYCDTMGTLGGQGACGKDYRVRESRDRDGSLVALLMEQSCGLCRGTGRVMEWVSDYEGTHDAESPEPCVQCGGSGWRLRCEIDERGFSLATYTRIAVVPLEQEEGHTPYEHDRPH